MTATVEWTRLEDFDEFGKPRPANRVIALTGRDERGNIIGIGGIAFLADGQRLAFTELTDEARKHPLALHKTALKILDKAKQRGIRRIIATADMAASPAAKRWLERLGFIEHEYNGVTVYVWRS